MRTHVATTHRINRPVAWPISNPTPAADRIDPLKVTGWALMLGANTLFWVAAVRAAQVLL